MKKMTFVRLCLLLIMVVGIFYIGVVKLNHELPDESRYELANTIVKTLKKDMPDYQNNEVYFEVTSSKVSINVYGELSKDKQEKIVVLINKNVISDMTSTNNTAIEINFFPKRSYARKEISSGVISSELVHAEPIRSVKLR